jgi:hypothetical protein
VAGLEIRDSEHVFIAGRTGTGKTVCARQYLTGFKYVVALDTKGKLRWPEIEPKDVTVVKHLKDLPDVQTPKIIYRPVWNELDSDYYNEFFRWCYKRENTVVWVDEVMGVCKSPFDIPDYYRAILTRGRELHVAVWSLTQRPSGIPQLIISEATHLFVYDLNLPQDRAKLVDVTGAEELSLRPNIVSGKKYSFWYYHVEAENARLARLVERRD